jgi:uncharacterized protein YlxW (UPF0749 family)
MTPGTHARGDAQAARPPRERRTALGWRFGTPLVVLLSGALFAVSATNSQGTDLRPGRYTDLASLVKAESDQYADLEQRLKELNSEVDALTEAVDATGVERARQRGDQMRDPAGLTPRSGTGVTVTLSDAPAEVIDTTDQEIRLLVVHQQDIQAVVNAMWKGGATAVTIAGQRIVSTTGIKCAGNSVQLQGVPYPQPYVIQAVGNQAAIVEAIEDDDYLDLYREQAEVPDIQIGWDLELEDQVTAPAYDGLLDLTYAEPIR